MMEEAPQKAASFHLAGIVPIAGAQSEFGFEWHGGFIPLAPGINAIEYAVHECALLGCETIWIVCNDDVAPLLRRRLGDYVRSADSLERGAFIDFSSTAYTSIPIYYVPIHPRHRDKIDCYPWSIIHGANVAYWLCRRLSRWLIPDRYYVSFPFGVYSHAPLKEVRKEIRSASPFYFSHEGNTVRDGLPLGFTFDSQEWKRARHVIKSNSRGYHPPEDGEQFPTRRLPKDERYQSRDYTLQNVFADAPLEAAAIEELNWFYDLTTWGGYCKLLSSTHCQEISAPTRLLFPGSVLNKLGEG